MVKETVVLTAVFETVDDGAVQARLEELPEVITSAATREEAEEMLIDALREYFLSFGSAATPIGVAPDATRAPLEITFQT
jgi:predicted RNase H-like HicB family nuclease